MDKKQQGILIRGVLANIKKVEPKEYEGRVSKAHQKLQVTILTTDGLSLIDIKDSNNIFKKEDENKIFDFNVAYTVVNNTAYFRLI